MRILLPYNRIHPFYFPLFNLFNQRGIGYAGRRQTTFRTGGKSKDISIYSGIGVFQKRALVQYTLSLVSKFDMTVAKIAHILF